LYNLLICFTHRVIVQKGDQIAWTTQGFGDGFVKYGTGGGDATFLFSNPENDRWGPNYSCVDFKSCSGGIEMGPFLLLNHKVMQFIEEFFYAQARITASRQ